MKTKSTFLLIILFIIVSLLFSNKTNAQVVLYGVTSSGGDSNAGTVFSVTPTGILTTIASLKASVASQPDGSLLYANDGNFYASSVTGGFDDSCTIFQCSPTGTLKTMINLDSVWGSSDPLGNSLIQAMDGFLYGMTTQGGPNLIGVLFKLPLSGHYTAVHFFNDTDGAMPYGSLIQTKDSMLWGMTSAGGIIDSGVGLGNIFHCTPSGEFTSVFSFDSIDGINPYGDLLLANDGNFYGLTSFGGKYGYGTLFRYKPSGTFTKLVDFNDTNGAVPYGSLIQASDGNLYGLTSAGGDSDQGTLFSYTLSGNLNTLLKFNNGTGVMPYGTLIQASDNNLYGLTNMGGNNSMGTIFQYTLSGNFTKLVDFNMLNGAYPEYGKLIEINDKANAIKEVYNVINTDVFPNPNNGQFTIQLSGISGQSSVEIYNMLGEKVFPQLSITNYPLSVSLNQPNGLYLYRILDENGNATSTGKFVIQK